MSGRKMTESFAFGPWKIMTMKSHILKSNCQTPEVCKDPNNMDNFCVVCRYERKLELPHLPEMVFAENLLKIEHSGGCGIQFTALDALALVDTKNDLMKVAVAKGWQEARSGNEFIREVIKPFDWTYTTDYKGTLLEKAGKKLKTGPTEERIDIEKLKVKEKIMFYSDIMLFEDELADNGCALLNVKIRVMPNSFFILMRFFLRVDNVLIRIIDTRIYHEAGQNFFIREFVSRERKVSDLLEARVPQSLFTDPIEINEYLTVTKETYEKIEF